MGNMLFAQDPKVAPPKDQYSKIFDLKEGPSHLPFAACCDGTYSHLDFPTPKESAMQLLADNEAFSMFVEAIKTEYEHNLRGLSKEEFENVVIDTMNSFVSIAHQIDALRMEQYLKAAAIFPALTAKKVDLDFIPDRKVCAKKMKIFRKAWAIYKKEMKQKIASNRYNQWVLMDHHRIDLNGEGQVMEAYEFNHNVYKAYLSRIRGNVTGHNVRANRDVITYITQMNIMWHPQIAEFWGSPPDIDFNRVNNMSAADCKETRWGIMLRKEYDTEQSAKRLLKDLKNGMTMFNGYRELEDGRIVRSTEGPMFQFQRKTYFVQPEDSQERSNGIRQSYCRELAKGKVWAAIDDEVMTEQNPSVNFLKRKLKISTPDVY